MHDISLRHIGIQAKSQFKVRSIENEEYQEENQIKN